MKQTRLLLTVGIAAAVVGFASLEPMAQGTQQQAVMSRSTGMQTDGLIIHIVPPSSEAARIPPELMAELRSVADP